VEPFSPTELLSDAFAKPHFCEIRTLLLRRCVFARGGAARGLYVVSIVLGVVLLATAGLKIAGGSNEVMRVALPFLSPRLFAAGVAFELILGIWLLSRIAPAWSWAISIAFFGLLAYMSFRLGILGQASCGCLGKKVHLSPWWAFAFDLSALFALWYWRPMGILAPLRRGLPVVAGAVLILAAVFASLIIQHGSTIAAFAYLRDEPVSVEPNVVHLGQGKLEEIRQIEVRLSNHTDQTVRIEKGSSDCSCISVKDLPIDMAPKSERKVTILVRYTGTPGVFRKNLSMYAVDGRIHVMPVAVTGVLPK
jgi:hypothetical protein